MASGESLSWSCSQRKLEKWKGKTSEIGTEQNTGFVVAAGTRFRDPRPEAEDVNLQRIHARMCVFPW
jgi:hypothetical protein